MNGKHQRNRKNQISSIHSSKAETAAGKTWKSLTSVFTAAALLLGSALPALAAESAMDVLCAPCGITAAEDGTFLVTDTYNKVIWKVEGRTSTVVSGGMTVEDPYGEPVGGYNDAAPAESFFREPWAIAPFLDGYAVSDKANQVVRLIRPDKTQTVNGHTAENLAIGTGVKFNRPTGLAADEAGNLYIADTGNNAIRKITSTGEVTTYAANLSEPTGLCWKNGVLYAAETGAHRVIRIENGQAIVIAGNGSEGRADGAAAQAQFSSPQGLAVSDDGVIYVSDTGNNAVRRIQNGAVTTLAACGQKQLEPYPIAPVGVMVQGGSLYVCDQFSRKVFVIPR